jgi:hypothetical protein
VPSPYKRLTLTPEPCYAAGHAQDVLAVKIQIAPLTSRESLDAHAVFGFDGFISFQDSGQLIVSPVAA